MIIDAKPSRFMKWGRLAVLFTLLAAMLVVGFSRLRIDTDIVRLLPDSDPIISDAMELFNHHLIQDRIVVDVGVERADLNFLTDTGDAVVERLKATGLFQKVGLEDMQQLMPGLISHAISNLPVLFSESDLKDRVAPMLEPENIGRKIDRIKENLVTLSGIGQTEFMQKDPLELRNIVLQRLSALRPTESGRIHGGHLVSADGEHLLIVATTKKSGTDTAFARKLDAALHDITRTFERRADGPTVTITPVGAYRSALDNETIVRKDVQKALVFATLGIALLLMAAFPRPHIGLLAFLPALAGMSVAIFIFSLFHESISIMVIGFGSAVISITVDHGILYLLFADRPYRTLSRDVSQEVRGVGFVAVATTAGAFAVLGLSDFPIFQQLGQFAALGILMSYVFVHTAFPFMMPSVLPARGAATPLQRFGARFVGIGKTPFWICTVFALVMVFFAGPSFNMDLSAMNTVSVSTRKAEQLMSRVWGAGNDRVFLMSRAESPMDLRRVGDDLMSELERCERNRTIGSAFVPSMFFPGESARKERFAAWRRFWTPARRADLQRQINAFSTSAGFSGKIFGPFFATLEADYRPPPMADIPESYFDLLNISKATENGPWRQLTLVSPGTGYDPEKFRTAFRGFGRIFDPAFFSKSLGVLLFDTFMKMIVYVGAAVFVLLMLFFASPTLTLITMVPVAFSIVATLGVLGLVGHSLDIPAVMLGVVVFGMGVDYALFFVRSFQRYGKVEHPHFVLVRTAVFMAAVSTLIGFGVLCLADHAMLRSIGFTLALGIGFAAIGAFMMIPALMHYRSKRLLDRLAKTSGAKEKVRLRYRMMEAYPRIFAKFKLRMDPMFEELPEMLPRDNHVQTILDVGTGFGVPAAWLLETYPNAEIYGIEPDAERVRIANSVIHGRGRVQTGRAPEVPNPSMRVDLAVVLDMIHYLNDEALEMTLSRIADRMRSGGRLLIRATVPLSGRRSVFWHVENMKLKIRGIHPFYRMPSTVAAQLSKSGFEVKCQKSSETNKELVWWQAVKR